MSKQQAEEAASRYEQPARRFVDTTEVAGLITFLAGPDRPSTAPASR